MARPPQKDGLASAYQILGVSPKSSKEEIRKAYKALSLKHHPDKTGPESTAKMALINAAYDVLKDAPDYTSQRAAPKRRRRSSLSTPPPSPPKQKPRHQKPEPQRPQTKKSKHNSNPPPPPPPKPTTPPWPTRTCFSNPPTPNTLPKPPLTFNLPSAASFQHLHKTHLSRLSELLSLANSILDFLKDAPFTASHPGTQEAAKHVVSWLNSEIRMHKHFYSSILTDFGWSPLDNSPTGKVAYWYVRTFVEGTRAKLSEMHTWLEGFMMDFMVAGKQVDESVEWEFVEKARCWCPEERAEDDWRC